MSDPSRTAVLFIECQRGVIGDLTVLPALAEEAQPARQAMGRLATGARGAGARVAHLTYLPLAGGLSANRRAPLMRTTRSSEEWTPSHPAMEVIPEIGVAPDDLVLPRHQGLSPVHRTEVLTILRNLGIDEVVVAGVSTNLALTLTAAGAADEDFAVTVVTDASVGTPASHHASMLKHSLRFVGRLATVDELVAEWSG
ncbi:MAG TPA: isochorismatase family protein [Acidimicrobiales bacterium]|jgi:nicotinamidase-related amidase|nr:isochorismatase family protein [Acidimicrobiales bacterium]